MATKTNADKSADKSDAAKADADKSADKEVIGTSKTPAWEHVLIYNKIKKRAKMGPFVRPSVIIEELKKVSRVPNTLHYPILHQMEEEGLIKRVNHQKYKLTEEKKNKRVKEINKKLKELAETVYGRKNRMLNIMEEYGLIKKDKETKFRILISDCDKKLELMGNFTFW